MSRILSFLVLFFLSLETLHAGITYTKPTKAEVDEGTKACMEKGKSSNEEKYICPMGSFQKDTAKPLTQEVIACSIKMSLTFSSIDEAAKKWMKELQKQREPDFNVWSSDIMNTVTELENTYSSVCKTVTWTMGDTHTEQSCAKTTDFFSETICDDLARKKAEAWKNAGYILATKGIAKNAQNAKDTFMDKKKTKYSELINKWNSYKRIVANAVAKMKSGAYVRSPVKN